MQPGMYSGGDMEDKKQLVAACSLREMLRLRDKMIF